MGYCSVLLELGATVSSLARQALQSVVHLEHQALGGVPVDARIGNRHAVHQLAQILGDRLAPTLQMALEHQADDRTVTVDDLRDAIFLDQALQIRILVRLTRTTAN